MSSLLTLQLVVAAPDEAPDGQAGAARAAQHPVRGHRPQQSRLIREQSPPGGAANTRSRHRPGGPDGHSATQNGGVDITATTESYRPWPAELQSLM